MSRFTCLQTYTFTDVFKTLKVKYVVENYFHVIRKHLLHFKR